MRGFLENKDYLRTYCAEFKEDIDHIMRVADDACNNTFLFDLKWDMERTYEPIHFEGRINFRYMPGDDKEFVWQFNRHRFAICLGQAYLFTGDKKYAENFVRIIDQFIEDEPFSKENDDSAWRILEVGIRAGNWLKALEYFEGCDVLTEDFYKRIYESLKVHARLIIDKHYDYCYAGNWGILENHGLFLMSVLMPLDDDTREEYRQHAIHVLSVAARIQIMPDGMQLEQSMMYHNEVMHCFTEVVMIAKRNGINLPEDFVAATRRMADADMTLIRPDHHQLTMCDSDYTDIRDYLSASAFTFNDPTIKFHGFDKADFETAFFIGSEGVKAYNAMTATCPTYTSKAMNESGHYVFRDSYSDDTNYLHFDCGTIGTSHGHSDKLHIDLILNGEDILVDAGRYTYVNKDERYYHRCQSGHNIITVDHMPCNEWSHSWCTKTLCRPIKQEMIIKDDYVYAEGGHLGYMYLDSPAYVNRRVLHIKPDIYVLFDEIYGSGEHTYTSSWHFNDEGKVSINNDKKIVTYESETAKCDMIYLNKNVEYERFDSYVSRHYNERNKNVQIDSSVKGTGFISETIVVSNKNVVKDAYYIPCCTALNSNVVDYSHAEALRIDVENKYYVIIICHDEMSAPVDLLKAENYMGSGEIMIFDSSKNHITGTVMKY